MLRLVSSVVVVAGLLLASPVYAEDNSTDSGRTMSSALERRKAALTEFEARRKAALEEVASRRTEFRAKLSEISDSRKQAIVENLATRIENVNGKWVTHWNNTLARLTEILAKIDERSGGGVNTTVAKAAIATAQTAVNTQAGKTYEIEIGEEETLGENVSETLKEFHADLRAVQTAVKTAREEVGKALRELKAEVGEEDEN